MVGQAHLDEEVDKVEDLEEEKLVRVVGVPLQVVVVEIHELLNTPEDDAPLPQVRLLLGHLGILLLILLDPLALMLAHYRQIVVQLKRGIFLFYYLCRYDERSRDYQSCCC